ncbi:hypothetical protein COV93_02240 [Candidatus Woesearchaeota archaeon CG11_big_fil_rev_8_21_14_0_20_43_8]|nr:MAG: hypothetical protein COV93_02240 [Candidatus Woesearchaeota archaeon CG11_big_fil_rev_8_21_14_0_20_43_8]PIO06714.1 MAG: hypothetical protein COT47_03015 [Candidatus Woesearchaeota archaeon CG08_land_8_20_14_0_20_43_7]
MKLREIVKATGICVIVASCVGNYQPQTAKHTYHEISETHLNRYAAYSAGILIRFGQSASIIKDGCDDKKRMDLMEKIDSLIIEYKSASKKMEPLMITKTGRTTYKNITRDVAETLELGRDAAKKMRCDEIDH